MNKNILDYILDISSEIKVPSKDIKEYLFSRIQTEYKKQFEIDCTVFEEENNNIFICTKEKRIPLDKLPLSFMKLIRSQFLSYVSQAKLLVNRSKIIDMENSIVTCTLVKIARFNAIVNINNISISIDKRSFLPNDILEIGKSYLFLVVSAKYVGEEFNIFLSRNSEEFIKKVIQLYIPETNSEKITIEHIYRIPRINNFVIMKSNLANCISYCMGSNASRVKNIIRELSGENILFINNQVSIYDNFGYIFRMRNVPFVINESGDRIQVLLNSDMYKRCIYKKQSIKAFEITYHKVLSIYDFKSSKKDLYKVFLKNIFKFKDLTEMFNLKPSLMFKNLLLSSDQVLNIYSFVLNICKTECNIFIEEDMTICEVLNSSNKNKKIY